MFNPHPVSEQLAVDDNVIRPIVKALCYDNSDYRFDEIPVEVLGTIYERFLGDEIRLTKEGYAKVEQKPEVRKAGGVYYTPQYIVEYIVKQTVGKLLERCKTPADVARLKILDPACGSGSFLLGAFDALIHWHETYFAAHPDKMTEKQGKQFIILAYKDERGNLCLTSQMKANILRNTLYGVDVDRQATEVAQMSLYLKVLEGLSNEPQLKLGFHDAILPSLDKNIPCGNSLISSDFFQNQLLFEDFRALTEKEKRHINPFDWDKKFPFLGDVQGFDAVIGNPPYALVGSDRPDEQQYFTSGLYKLTAYKINLYVLFLERGLKLLKNFHSFLGFIIPKSLVFNTFFKDTRMQLLSRYEIPMIVEIREKVFEDAEVGDSILFFARKGNTPTENVLRYFKVKNIVPQFDIVEQYEATQHDLLSDSESQFYKKGFSIKVPVRGLGEIAMVSNGLNPGNVRHILLSISQITDKHKRMVLGRDVQRYELGWSGMWVNYDPTLKDRIKLSDIKSKAGMTAQKRVDFALRTPEIYTPNKILVRKTADHIIATYDPEGFYYDSLAYGVQLNPDCKLSTLYVLGILNSRLLNFLHEGIAMNQDKVFAKVLAENLKKLPIRVLDISRKEEKIKHAKMAEFVEKMLKLHQDKSTASAFDREHLEMQIERTDQAIDALVYDLYGLTADEIAIIEQSV
jgi:type I restriction-modification system DNA methylase subunit